MPRSGMHATQSKRQARSSAGLAFFLRREWDDADDDGADQFLERFSVVALKSSSGATWRSDSPCS
jgi:hypothetical protein